jgi:hypothetical protein
MKQFKEFINETHLSDARVKEIKASDDEKLKAKYKEYTDAEKAGDKEKADKLAKQLK